MATRWRKMPFLFGMEIVYHKINKQSQAKYSHHINIKSNTRIAHKHSGIHLA